MCQISLGLKEVQKGTQDPKLNNALIFSLKTVNVTTYRDFKAGHSLPRLFRKGLICCSKICISAQILIIRHRFLRLEDFANVFLKSGQALTTDNRSLGRTRHRFVK